MKNSPSATTLALLRQKSGSRRKFLVGSSTSKLRLMHNKERIETEANIFCDSTMVGIDSIIARFKEVEESPKIIKLELEDLLVAGHSNENFKEIATTAKKLILSCNGGGREWGIDGHGVSITFIDSLHGSELDTLRRWQTAKNSMMRDYENEFTYGVHLASRISHLKGVITLKATINIDQGTSVADLLKILRSIKLDNKDLIAFRMINTSTGSAYETADELVASVDWTFSPKNNNNGGQTGGSMVINIACGWQKSTAESKSNKLLLTCCIFGLNKRAKEQNQQSRRNQAGSKNSNTNNCNRGIRRTLSHGGGLDRRRGGSSPSIRHLRIEHANANNNKERPKAATSFSSSESLQTLIGLANETKSESANLAIETATKSESASQSNRSEVHRTRSMGGSFRSRSNRRLGLYKASPFDDIQNKKQMYSILKRSISLDDNKNPPLTTRQKQRPGVERSLSCSAPAIGKEGPVSDRSQPRHNCFMDGSTKSFDKDNKSIKKKEGCSQKTLEGGGTSDSLLLKRSISLDDDNRTPSSTGKHRRLRVERSSSCSDAAATIGKQRFHVERSSSSSAAATGNQRPFKDKCPPKRWCSMDGSTKPFEKDDTTSKKKQGCSKTNQRRKSKEAEEVMKLHGSSKSLSAIDPNYHWVKDEGIKLHGDSKSLSAIEPDYNWGTDGGMKLHGSSKSLSAVEPDYKWRAQAEEQHKEPAKKKSTGKVPHDELAGKRATSNHELTPDHHWELPDKLEGKSSSNRECKPDHHWELPGSPKSKSSKPEHQWELPGSLKAKSASNHEPRPEHQWDLSGSLKNSSSNHERKPDHCWGQPDPQRGKSTSSHEPRPEHNWALPDPLKDHGTRLPADFNWKVDQLGSKSNSNHEPKSNHKREQPKFEKETSRACMQ